MRMRVLPGSPLPSSLRSPRTLPSHTCPCCRVPPHAGLNFSYACSRIYSYYWFMIAMQILSVVALLVLSCIRLLASAGISFLAWFTVLTALFIQGSDTFLAVQDLAAGTGLVSGPQAGLRVCRGSRAGHTMRAGVTTPCPWGWAHKRSAQGMPSPPPPCWTISPLPCWVQEHHCQLLLADLLLTAAGCRAPCCCCCLLPLLAAAAAALQFGDSYKYSRLTSAGWIITSIANLAIIFILGWRPRRVASSSGFGK